MVDVMREQYPSTTEFTINPEPTMNEMMSSCSTILSMTAKKKKMKNSEKRRFSNEQIRSLEVSFESETKLEPRKKVELAKELGLQPRQVAIWFQNKRARWKSKQIEKDYALLLANYHHLSSQFETLKKENHSILIQLEKLKKEIDGVENHDDDPDQCILLSSQSNDNLLGTAAGNSSTSISTDHGDQYSEDDQLKSRRTTQTITNCDQVWRSRSPPTKTELMVSFLELEDYDDTNNDNSSSSSSCGKGEQFLGSVQDQQNEDIILNDEFGAMTTLLETSSSDQDDHWGSSCTSTSIGHSDHHDHDDLIILADTLPTRDQTHQWWDFWSS